MTSDLRRLRLHGLSQCIPRTHRYRITATRAIAANFYARLYARAIRPGFSSKLVQALTSRSSAALAQMERAISRLLQEVHLAA
jgi:hypothetical protein